MHVNPYTDCVNKFLELHNADPMPCTLCVEPFDFTDPKAIKELSIPHCGKSKEYAHVFHEHCLKESLQTVDMCPLCREPNVGADIQQSSSIAKVALNLLLAKQKSNQEKEQVTNPTLIQEEQERLAKQEQADFELAQELQKQEQQVDQQPKREIRPPRPHPTASGWYIVDPIYDTTYEKMVRNKYKELVPEFYRKAINRYKAPEGIFSKLRDTITCIDRKELERLEAFVEITEHGTYTYFPSGKRTITIFDDYNNKHEFNF